LTISALEEATLKRPSLFVLLSAADIRANSAFVGFLDLGWFASADTEAKKKVKLRMKKSLIRADSKVIGDVIKDVEPEDLIKFGLIPEFIGRLPVVATLESLSEDALVQILTEPKNALTKQYIKLFAMEDVSLEFRPSALRLIAKKALERKTGARGLRSIMEHVLLDTMYELPSIKNLEKVVIDDGVIEQSNKPILLFSEKKQVSGKK